MPIINPGLPTESYYPDPRPKLPSRKELNTFLTQERAYSRRQFELLQSAAEDVKLATRIRRQTNRARGHLWTCGDGARVPVNEMADAHLFFAIAKARRNEYPDSRSRQQGVEALEAEALRRLAGL